MPEIKHATLRDFYRIFEMFMMFILPSSAAKVQKIDPSVICTNLINWIADERVLTIVSDNGFMIAFQHPSFFSDEVIAAELAWWVNPLHTGTGEGKALKNAFEEWAVSIGCTVTALGVGSAFSTAEGTRAFLLKDGYLAAETNYMKKI